MIEGQEEEDESSSLSLCEKHQKNASRDDLLSRIDHLENQVNKLSNELESMKKNMKFTIKKTTTLKLKEEKKYEALRINVGGKIFDVSKSTLDGMVPKSLMEPSVTVPHFLSALVKKNLVERDVEGYVFIDRDWVAFEYILNYLREQGNLDRMLFPDPETKEGRILRRKIFIEADYFGMQHLKEALKFPKLKISYSGYTTSSSSPLSEEFSCKGGGWVVNSSTCWAGIQASKEFHYNESFFLFTFSETTLVYGIVMQGRKDKPHWITELEVSTSLNGKGNDFKSAMYLTKVNENRYHPKWFLFDYPILVKRLKLHHFKFYGALAFRTGILVKDDKIDKLRL